ncbi:hypothetical protein CTAYLR_005094 [Chrysophaeum taylorii]|uniref:PPM-type phosphatase domain-containing protein n=1 Tax=Chrysophaeum taylorii TaxID=2483200 RepID=A0AAD7XLY0_9STRA|nr:hypothetical protein CTAYLR_005094 [Chrysophaeum taylorii]
MSFAVANTSAVETPRSAADGFKGLKESYEDRVASVFLEGVGYAWGLFDGHGGAAAADYVREFLFHQLGEAAKGRVENFAQVLERVRTDLKRERVAATRGDRVRLTPERRSVLERLEAAASEVETRLADLNAYSYAPPETLVRVRAALEARRPWLDAASLARGGGPRAVDALRDVLAREREGHRRVEECEAEAAKTAAVVIADDAWKEAARDAFLRCDLDFLDLADRKGLDDGTCALVAVLAPASKQGRHKLVVANAGDSRALLLRGTRVVRASTDHKPDVERRRVEKAGGYVVDVGGVKRVTSASGVGFGVDRSKKSLYLSVARAIGDRQLKKPSPVVVATPDVKIFALTPDDSVLVLVCDGITDALQDDAIIHAAIAQDDPEDAARTIVRDAFSKGAADNLTALVVRFPWSPPHPVLLQNWEAARRPPHLLDVGEDTPPGGPLLLRKKTNKKPTIDMFA